MQILDWAYENVVNGVPGKVLIKINKAVGFRLFTKFGTKGTVNLVKMVPVAGAVVGGGFDIATTRAIAKVAKKTFLERGLDLGNGEVILRNEIQ